MMRREINNRDNLFTRILAMLAAVALLSIQQAIAETEQTPTTTAQQSKASYLIGSGDALEISVWKEPELTKQLIVPPDGVISFPLAGAVHVEGKTIEQITDAISQRLDEVIVDPVVNVLLLGFESQQIYVLGKVNKPGVFQYHDNIDVMQALAMAAGMATFADQDSIKILRRENGKLMTFPFDYSDLESGERLEQNILLRRGDVVIVP